jgi:hypothetical protein
VGRSASVVLEGVRGMQIHKPFSFLKNAKKRVLENNTLRFLFFKEKTPKHRVMENISITFLAFLSLACFAAGLAGFVVWERYTFFGFLSYYAVVLFGVLELLHCLFDR